MICYENCFFWKIIDKYVKMSHSCAQMNNSCRKTYNSYKIVKFLVKKNVI